MSTAGGKHKQVSNILLSLPDLIQTQLANMAETTSDSPEKSVCKLCEKQFEPPNDPLIQCDRCDGWICLNCANMTEEQYKFFISETNKNISHLWFCTHCFPSATTCVKTDNEIEEKCKSYFERLDTKFSSEVSAIKEDLTHMRKEMNDNKAEARSDLQELQRKLEEHKSFVEEKVENGADINKVIEDKVKQVMDESTETAVNEIRERDERKLNLLCFNITESTKDEGEERKKDDLETLKKLLEELQVQTHISNPTRLGKKTNGTNRPLRLTVSTLQERNSLLKASTKLKGTENFKEVVIAKDMTPLERKSRRLLVQLKKRRQEESTAAGENVEWVIRNNKVVRKRDLQPAAD